MEPIIIEYASRLYPKMLRNIEKPPSRLYVLGNIEVLNDIGIAVIGSRTNTEYGEKMCKKFVKGLLEYNINIISGLAFGIDSIAHESCLKNGGKTIAVLPSGLKKICKATNKMLIDEIIKNDGAVISEYENDIEADSNKFLERNRIVAGLGIGTLVVEAGYRSGTSVTARFTQQNEKPVFCVPSSLENMKGILTNELIQKGAKLVRNAEDIIEEINKVNPEIEFNKKEVKKKNLYFDISPELLNVYKEITDMPKDLNQIARKTGLSISEVNYKTMMLQLEDKIVELPGQRFIRNDN
mgnify:CR=1 FL=1